MQKNSTKPLTDRQKEIVKGLQLGGILFVPHSHFIKRSDKIMLRNGSQYSFVNKGTFNSLKLRGLIYQHTYKHSDSSVYKITAIGKKLKIS